ncbi:hypothetical protein SOVF_040170 [Spinacia oleracea]|uniref:Uncharacterized membrane protein At3g27390 n=1 Tax=Spinacia oleracea TaxID=3562 RepID=A0A9R0IU63_SPIOL|nr:uncharacterized membrane protein At3g27390-like [Spinacia oleracea]XP_021855065.1 uncharacterized membrane protein At3g27390-like [Spinacia oleracea]XP_056698335.1 uncharacterized membrane protein At3g27390-like [Spinacia oleracea]XP_056698336.1 uncharacterized membrane protein At3g27390-like [Spinacia oleracea]KNA21790.1 hypothetical protein SOVF_040170 [Spinacia oleracea]
MAEAKVIIKYIAYAIFFIPICIILLLLGLVKSAIFNPFVFLVIAFGVTGVVIGLWPCHLFYSIYCIIRTKKFGPFMKIALILLSPLPIAIWTVVGVLGSVVMAKYYAFVWPVMETFRAISTEGSVPQKLFRCLTNGTWSNVWGACTIVRDFADFSFHSFFSVMDGLLESNEEEPIELKVLQLPGCVLSAALGIVVDVIFIPLITLYKSPLLLFKGWHRLVQDLVGREGPFLETVCVPFAGLLILLWPIAVVVAIVCGVLSSIGFGCYAAVVAYQEESTKKGLLYAIASVSIFDEYTNDLLYLREGSCFPRPNYRGGESSSFSLLPVKGLHEQLDGVYKKEPLLRTTSAKKRALNSIMIWDNFFKGCEQAGKDLLTKGAITTADLSAWQQSKNNQIINVGVPAYVLVDCLLRSIKSGSTGFLLGNNVEMTGLNRPEGKVFDWLFEPMSIMKEQLRNLKLTESEELYLSKLSLYRGDTARMAAWDNGGAPPREEIRRAQLEGLSRRLQGFCLTISRLPTSRRKFIQVDKEIAQELNRGSISLGSGAV